MPGLFLCLLLYMLYYLPIPVWLYYNYKICVLTGIVEGRQEPENHVENLLFKKEVLYCETPSANK